MRLPRVHPALLTLLAERDRAGRPPLDDFAWDRLADDAERHGLAPWLYQWSCSHPSVIPPRIHDRLKANVTALTGKTLILQDELATILRELGRHKVPCLPLRGLALATYLPAAPAVRPMGDLDLLVRREDYAGVRRILQQLGYAEMDRRPGFAEAYSYTLEFVKDRHGWITVEPHWTLAYPPFMETIDMDAVWSRCRRGTVAGIETSLLSLEDLLINLCWHLHHKGAEAPLLWWVELDLLLRRHASAVNWPRLVSTVGPGSPAGLIADVLSPLALEFHSPISDQAIAELSGSASRAAPRSTRVLAGPLTVDGSESLAQLFAISGLRAKIRYGWALLMPSREFMMMHYAPASPAQLYLRYARRILSCAGESLKGLANLFLPARRSSLP